MNGEQLTLLPAESLASLSVWPGSRQARRMTVTSGRKLLASLPSCDRELSWLRTLVGSSAWRSTMCLLTWKHKTTPAGRSYYQLQVSAPRTRETESGLWPTPRAAEAAHAGRLSTNHTGQTGLAEAANRSVLLHTPTSKANQLAPSMRERDAGSWLLPTPDAGMVQGGRTLPEGTSPTGMTPDGKKRQVGLTNAVKMLPTPRASDCHHEGIDAGIRHKEKWGSQTLATTARVSSQSTAKLNPAWVSRMMGFPDSWMDVGEATP